MTFGAISPIRIFKFIFSFSLQNMPTNWAVSATIFNFLFHRTILWVYSSSIFYNFIYVYVVYIYIFWNFVKFCSLFATLLGNLFRCVYENNFKLANTNNFLEGGINSPIRRLLSQHRGMKYEHQMRLVELYLFKRSKLYNLVKLGEHFGT